MNKKELAQYIDQTLLSPAATEKEVEDFCKKAKDYEFASVCINPCYVETAAMILKGSKTKVCTVIDFPLGAGGLENKMAEADLAVTHGANELDYVVSLGLVKSHRWDLLSAELTALQRASSEAAMWQDPEVSRGAILTKLILETCLLTDEEIVEVSKCAKKAGFDFVKTSTGFASAKPNGASVHAVELMKETVGDMGVKASGGIRTTQDALDMIKAGASRIGTSSGVEIVDGLSC